MRPVEFDSFLIDVEAVLKRILDKFHFKVIFKDKSSFYCKNKFIGIWIYYEGSSLQFIIIDSKNNKWHIYELLEKKGLSHLVPVRVDTKCLEQFKKEFNSNFEFYLSDLCWLNKINDILLQNCQDIFIRD